MERVVWLDNDGNLNARSGHFRDSFITDGSIEGATMRIGSGNHVFKADYNGIYLGAEIFEEAPFRVGLDGILYANAAHLKDSFITDGELVGGSLTIGKGDSVLHVNEQGIYLGNDDPNSAPFWVNPKGRATMSDLVIKGSDGQTMLETNGNKMWLNNMDLEGVGRLLAEMLEVNTILADDGYVNNLTVNRLKTIGKDADVGQFIDYIDIQDNYQRWITAQVQSKEQATDSRDRLLFWQDSEKRILTTEDTGIIAYAYKLTNEKIKREISFNGSGDAAQPTDIIGTGDGGADNRAKMVNTKYNGGYKQVYKASNIGKERSVDFKDSGVYLDSQDAKMVFTAKELTAMADGGPMKIGNTNGYIEITVDGTFEFHGKAFNFHTN